MASTTEDTKFLHRSVLFDHTINIKGVICHEKKVVEMVSRNEDGVKMWTLSHLRSIGDRTYTTNQKIVGDGEVKDETFETTLTEDEVADFKKDWEDNCHPIFAAIMKDWEENFHPMFAIGGRYNGIRGENFFIGRFRDVYGFHERRHFERRE